MMLLIMVEAFTDQAPASVSQILRDVPEVLILSWPDLLRGLHSTARPCCLGEPPTGISPRTLEIPGKQSVWEYLWATAAELLVFSLLSLTLVEQNG